MRAILGTFWRSFLICYVLEHFYTMLRVIVSEMLMHNLVHYSKILHFIHFLKIIVDYIRSLQRNCPIIYQTL